MDRKIPGPPRRNYDQAVPIRVGKLRFPVTGPSAFKKKGILGKSGNYFSKEANEELCLLLKVISHTTGTNRYVPLVAEEKVIWTWEEDVYGALEKYLKTEPEGMCRHTAALVSEKNREIKNSHKGVCMRTECNDTLGITDLLMTFLKKPLTAKARNERYNYILNNFPPSKEIVLFDPQLPEFQNKQLVIDGIQKKTMRHVLHSNGKQLWVFDIVYYTNSKLEEMKNMLRPLALNGKRKGTDRGFILEFVASDDKDSLSDWWKDFIYHTNGLNSNDFHSENSDECNIENLFKGLSFTNTVNNKGERFSKENFSMTTGEGVEAFKQSFDSSLSVEDLMSLLIQTENISEKNNCLDSYIFSTSANGADKLQILVDPTNKADKVLDRYGNSTQRMLLQAVTKDEIESNVSFVPEFISNLSMFSFLKGMTSAKSETFTRYLDMEKSYVINGEQEFSVSYLPASETDYIGKLSNTGAVNSVLDHIILKIKQASIESDVKNITVDGHKMTYLNFNLMWEEKRKTAIEAFKKQICKSSVFPMGLSNVRALEEKQLVSYLFEGHRESAVVAVLELVQQMTDRYVKTGITVKNDGKVISFLLRAIQTIVEKAQTAFVIETAFFIQRQLLLNAMTARNQAHQIKNSICSTYLSTFQCVQRKHKFSLLPDLIIRDTLGFMKEKVISSKLVPSCILSLCNSFIKIGRAHSSTIYTSFSTVLQNSIKYFITELCSVEIMLLAIKQDRALTEIANCQAMKESKIISVPYILEHDVQRGKVVIKTTLFDTANDDCFKLRKDKVTILASAKGIKNETARVLSTKNVSFKPVDTGSAILEAETTSRKFVAESVGDFIGRIRSVLESNISSPQLACSILEHAQSNLLNFASPNRSRITVCVKGDRSRVFGTSFSNSNVANSWGSQILNSVDNGLKAFTNAL